MKVEFKSGMTISLEKESHIQEILHRVKGVINNHNQIAKTLALARSIKADTKFLVHDLLQDKDQDKHTENVELTDGRLRQFMLVCSLWREKPDLTLYAVCKEVFAKTKNGYPTAKSLHRYCLQHKVECHQ